MTTNGYKLRDDLFMLKVTASELEWLQVKKKDYKSWTELWKKVWFQGLIILKLYLNSFLFKAIVYLFVQFFFFYIFSPSEILIDFINNT